MNRPSVDPAFTFGVSLAISLVLWYPTLRGTMRGDIEITDAGIRYFLALAIAWAGVYGVSVARRDVREQAARPRRRRRRRDPGRARRVTARRRQDDAGARRTGQRRRRTRNAAWRDVRLRGRGTRFARLARGLLAAADQAVTLGRR